MCCARHGYCLAQSDELACIPCARLLNCHGRSQVSTQAGLSLTSCEAPEAQKAGYVERVLAARSSCFERSGEAWKTWQTCVDRLGVQQADLQTKSKR